MNKQIFKPLGSRIIVRPDKPEEKSAGGIFIPESAQSRIHKGEVVEVGVLSQAIAKGDRIMYAKEAGLEIEVNGEKLIVLQEDNAMALLESSVESIPVG
jgi:chaperonin GroES